MRSYLFLGFFLLSSLTFGANGEGIDTLARDEAVAKHLSSEQGHWLTAGSDRFLAVYRAAKKTPIHGTVLIFPDQYTNPDWHPLIADLSETLSARGWHVLSLSLPLPIASDKKTNAASDGKNAVLDVQLPRVRARIESALTFIAEQDQKNKKVVLLGHGTGATWAAAFLTESPSKNLLGIVALSAYWPEESRSRLLMQQLGELKKPVLDIYGSDDDLRIQESAQLRNQAAKLKKSKQFTQLKLIGADYYYHENAKKIVRLIQSKFLN